MADEAFPREVDLAMFVAQRRIAMDLSHEDLATRSDIPQATIVGIESGELPYPHMDILDKLGPTLGVRFTLCIVEGEPEVFALQEAHKRRQNALKELANRGGQPVDATSRHIK